MRLSLALLLLSLNACDATGASATDEHPASPEVAQSLAAEARHDDASAGSARPASGKGSKPSLTTESRRDEAAARFARFRSQLEHRLDRSNADLQPHRREGDVTVVPLKGRFGHASVARRNLDGRVELGCFERAEGAAEFLAGSKGEVKP